MMSQPMQLLNGLSMPNPGFGTSIRRTPNGEVKAAVHHAIKCGYRHIDTAQFYNNESEVGEAVSESISDGIVGREELFICSKLVAMASSPVCVRRRLLKSLKDLQVDYLDLLLIHFPVTMINKSGEEDSSYEPLLDYEGRMIPSDVDYLDIYKEMEKFVDEGLVRSLGVSNFNLKQTMRVYNEARIKPANLQIECHVWLFQSEIIDYCKSNGIVVTAYAPIGSPARPGVTVDSPQLLSDPLIVELAEKYQKTPAQVCLRYLVQQSIVPLPKSLTPERIQSNLQIFDFKLSDEDMMRLRNSNKNLRLFSMSSHRFHKVVMHHNYPWPEIRKTIQQ